MAKNIDFMGAIFPDVPSIRLPQHEGGLVAFDDTTDATATADKILQGYTAYANGQKLTGTASGGITPSGTMSITSNGTYDVTQYASADVSVSGGGGGLTLLKEESLGQITYSSTSAGTLGKSVAVNGIDAYDLLLLVIKADNPRDGYHLATVSCIGLTSNGNYSHDHYIRMGSVTGVFNFLKNSTGIASNSVTRGIYSSAPSVSSGQITMPLYARYNNSTSLTIDDTYTARVYGLKYFEDLIVG